MARTSSTLARAQPDSKRRKVSHYNRNIMHMNPYSPDEHLQHQQRAVVDNNVYVNSYVAVLDADDDTNYHVAKVLNITDTETTLHYMGTRSKTMRSAK